MADTLTMRVIAALDSEPNLRLVSFSAAQQALAGQWSGARIARELRVQWIAHGTLVQSSDTLRVTMHLLSQGEAAEPWVRTFTALRAESEALVQALRDSLKAHVSRGTPAPVPRTDVERRDVPTPH